MNVTITKTEGRMLIFKESSVNGTRVMVTSSICIARRATSIGKTTSVLVKTIWYLVLALRTKEEVSMRLERKIQNSTSTWQFAHSV